MTPQFVQMPLVQESPDVDTQALFLPSTPSPPPFLSPMPMPVNRLAPMSWNTHVSLPEITGMNDDWTWYGPQASPFDDGSLSSSPSASSPSSSTPSTPPQQFPQAFLASPTVASSPAPAPAFDPYANPFVIPDLGYPDFPAYPGDGVYAGALAQRTDDVWFGMPSVPGELPSMGVRGGLRGEAESAYNGEQGLELYDSLIDYTSAKGYMG
ncbi:hypothetical protein DAEQUDRAFT_386240 [Daedalea quercina L-15889]|uniref:Uncharacterized protein n=1 Tax=Daedalea quercina L-15889 TaxID=1314783 RepID=A0A165P2F4_9APHY|nr:hypothetical protein DAEQUDRAFT_386240 [Daedalea quercina L-15889]